MCDWQGSHRRYALLHPPSPSPRSLYHCLRMHQAINRSCDIGPPYACWPAWRHIAKSWSEVWYGHERVRNENDHTPFALTCVVPPTRNTSCDKRFAVVGMSVRGRGTMYIPPRLRRHISCMPTTQKRQLKTFLFCINWPKCIVNVCSLEELLLRLLTHETRQGIGLCRCLNAEKWSNRIPTFHVATQLMNVVQESSKKHMNNLRFLSCNCNM